VPDQPRRTSGVTAWVRMTAAPTANRYCTLLPGSILTSAGTATDVALPRRQNVVGRPGHARITLAAWAPSLPSILRVVDMEVGCVACVCGQETHHA
jgi:hypothetical protein